MTDGMFEGGDGDNDNKKPAAKKTKRTLFDDDDDFFDDSTEKKVTPNLATAKIKLEPEDSDDDKKPAYVYCTPDFATSLIKTEATDDDNEKPAAAAAAVVTVEPVTPKKKKYKYVPSSPLYPVGTHGRMMNIIDQRSPVSREKILKKREEEGKRREKTFKYFELQDEIELFVNGFLEKAQRESTYYRESYLGRLQEMQDDADGELLEELLMEQAEQKTKLAQQVEQDRKLAHVLHQEELDEIVEYNRNMRKESK